MPFRPALIPLDVDVTVTLGGAIFKFPAFAFPPVPPAPPPPAPPILPAFCGQPLYCHAQSNGTTLSIIIDDDAGDDIDSMGSARFPAATQLDVTLKLNWGPVLQHWATIPAAYAGANDLRFSATLDGTLTHLHLFVDDNAAAPVATKDGKLTFILAEVPSGDYRIHWIREEDIKIDNADTRTDATLVRPPLPGTIGGVLGPMGFTTT